ncbi:hypothetical protein SADUNF_Sadunf04G0101700 [Salix dunnii]|uniref:Uncharacterized protein n=1 Tax=Salix dunnii TaxID=1413687 RepID=A0A835KEB2_9ROSI|nr:hypothetical protein SADUNF_Sadunf04G0101700 [Salix dunnii]
MGSLVKMAQLAYKRTNLVLKGNIGSLRKSFERQKRKKSREEEWVEFDSSEEDPNNDDMIIPCPAIRSLGEERTEGNGEAFDLSASSSSHK